jgi:LysM repeat protein
VADSLRQPRARSRYSVWSFVAPVALLACVSIIVVIAEGAGWVGQKTPQAVHVVHHRRHHVHQPTSVTAVAGSNAPAASSSTTPPATTSSTTTSTTATTPGAVATPGKLFYAVRVGDSLASIAARFGTSVADLRTLNPAVDPATLHPGQELRLR